MEILLNLKDKRKIMVRFLMQHCNEVLEDMKHLKDVETIANLEKEEFCELVDDIIDDIEEDFRHDEYMVLDNIKYLLFEIAILEDGQTNAQDEEKYLYVRKWLKPIISNFDKNKEFIYRNTLCISITDTFAMQIMNLYELFSYEDENALLRRWIVNENDNYQFDNLDDVTHIFFRG